MAGRQDPLPVGADHPGDHHRSGRRPRGESNVDHLCLTVHPVDWDEVIKSGTFTVLEGPVQRFGARGTATSIYIQDPDTNTLELRWYPQDAGPSDTH